MKRTLFTIAVVSFAVGLACGFASAMYFSKHEANHAKIDKGTEVISILEEEIMSLTFNSDKVTFTAQRSKPAADFVIQVTFADGTPSQQCHASSDLNGHLKALSTLTTKRQLNPEQLKKEFPNRLGTLEIKDRMLTEPVPRMELRTSSDRQALSVNYDGVAVELANAAKDFIDLEQGCKLPKR